MKIKDFRNSEKVKFQISKRLLCGGISLLLAFKITGCGYNQNFTDGDNPGKIKEAIERCESLERFSGFIKNGEDLIPYFQGDLIFAFHDFYDLETGQCIGIVDDEIVRSTETDDIYVVEQIVPFGYVCSTANNWDFSEIANISEENFQTYERKFLEIAKFSKEKINLIEIENLDTNESKKIVGYQIKLKGEKAKIYFFNFETYKVECYIGNYNINYILEGKNLENSEYSLEEILNLKEQNENYRRLLENPSSY